MSIVHHILPFGIYLLNLTFPSNFDLLCHLPCVVGPTLRPPKSGSIGRDLIMDTQEDCLI